MSSPTTQTPWYFWLIVAGAFLFNAYGVFDFSMTMAKGAAYLESAGMTPPQVAHTLAMPSWMTIVWATGVFSALAASILLLLRRKQAFPVFALSLGAFLISVLYSYVLTDGGAILGPQAAMVSAVIAGLLAILAWFSRWMSARGVLR